MGNRDSKNPDIDGFLQATGYVNIGEYVIYPKFPFTYL